MKIKIIFWMFLFLLFACTEPETNSLIVNVDLVIQKSDSIQVFYSKNNSINFTEKQSFWTRVKGNKRNQKIQIVFPDTLMPKQIRLDFGRNKQQPEIIINKFTFKYQKKQFSAKGKEIFIIFREDQNNTFANQLSGSISRKNPSQNNGPSLYPRGEKLNKQLNLLYQTK